MYYTPYEQRTPDTQYRDTLALILEKGERTISQQETDAYTYIAPPPMRFRLCDGFPLITERSLDRAGAKVPTWQSAIGELFAFINGVRTLDGLKSFGCYWWKFWATPEKCAKRGLAPGDLGPGSYGAAFHDFPMPDGSSFNQFEALVAEIKRAPHLRTLVVTPWIPFYIPRTGGAQQKVVVAPCHGWIHVRIINGKLTLHMSQRSADMVLGVPSNLTQYAALTLALAHVTGYEAYEYVHSLSDAHIFVNHRDAAEEMCGRKKCALPTMTLESPPDDIFAFRREHFILSDYHPNEALSGLEAAI